MVKRRPDFSKERKWIKRKGTFYVWVMSPARMLYEGEASSVFLEGDQGSFEILPYHYPVFSLLKEGEIIIDWEKKLKIKSGIVRFFGTECVIIAE